MRIPHVDRIPPNPDVFAFDSNSSVLSLPSVTVKYEFFISLHDNLVPTFHMFGDLVPVLHTLEFYTDFFQM